MRLSYSARKSLYLFAPFTRQASVVRLRFGLRASRSRATSQPQGAKSRSFGASSENRFQLPVHAGVAQLRRACLTNLTVDESFRPTWTIRRQHRVRVKGPPQDASAKRVARRDSAICSVTLTSIQGKR